MMARARRSAVRARLLLVGTVVMLAAIIGALTVIERVGNGSASDAASDAFGVDHALLDEPAARVRPCTRGGPAREVAEASREAEAAGRVSSAAILACPSAYAGRTVVYVGEVIGDLLRRDGGAWVLVNDDPYALEVGPLPLHTARRGTNQGLSVWLPEATLSRITALGRPGQRGDVVAVTGVVHRADRAAGGALTLRAEELEVLAPAVRMEDPVEPWQLALAFGLVGIAGVLEALRRRSLRR
jgi:hypothetical protein